MVRVTSPCNTLPRPDRLCFLPLDQTHHLRKKGPKRLSVGHSWRKEYGHASGKRFPKESCARPTNGQVRLPTGMLGSLAPGVDSFVRLIFIEITVFCSLACFVPGGCALLRQNCHFPRTARTTRWPKKSAQPFPTSCKVLPKSDQRLLSSPHDARGLRICFGGGRGSSTAFEEANASLTTRWHHRST